MMFRGPFHKNEVHLEKSLHFLYFNTSKGSILDASCRLSL